LFRNTPGSIGLYLLGFLTAFVLGAFHALSPGHGKSMVAAYLMGSRGRIVDAVRLGLIVTLTHVLSVVALGLLALVLSRYTLSGNVFPWLGVASGVLIFATGYYLLARMAVATDQDHHDHHHHGHEPHHHHHEHEPSDHQHEHGHSLKEIISLGIAGGLVPCPSAIVILLFAVAVNRIVTGLIIILSFSLGLASVLILIGILTVTASQRLKRFRSGMNWVRRLPVFSAGIIMVLGVIIGINALLQAGILRLNL
jgi:ABC-type nickel/cobalt efflux system permease component RcnA